MNSPTNRTWSESSYIYTLRQKKSSISDSASAVLNIAVIFLWQVLWTILQIRYFLQKFSVTSKRFRTLQLFLPLIEYLLFSETKKMHLLFFKSIHYIPKALFQDTLPWIIRISYVAWVDKCLVLWNS